MFFSEVDKDLVLNTHVLDYICIRDGRPAPWGPAPRGKGGAPPRPAPKKTIAAPPRPAPQNTIAAQPRPAPPVEVVKLRGVCGAK